MFRRKPPSPTTIEWMIVGLGNPGPEYRGTRHNVGFAVVEYLAEKHKIKLNRGRNKAIVGTGEVAGHSVALIKPMTFMNLSGQAVGPLARQFNLKPSHVLVVADDLDLPIGKLRLRSKGSAGGHNGHKSVAQYLQTSEYPRLKVGIDSVEKGRTIDHVLSTFDRGEMDCIDDAIRASAQVCEVVVSGTWAEALRIVESHNK
jgi:PTH1 family peptidyl-tRNA hydrolase